MKVVIDTNVLMSAIFFGGVPSKILEQWKNGKFKTVVSELIILEYVRVADELNKKFEIVDITKVVEYFILNSEIIDTGNLRIEKCEDPDDNKFLECAIAGNCKVIISGDKHLLKLNPFEGIEILKPREFLNRFLTK